MKEIPQQVFSDIESIKKSLEILSKDGMKIIDTYADVSTPINFKSDLLVAIIGTVIGGIITIILFRMQEKYRTKKELQLEFFKKYKKLYEEFKDTFNEFKSKMRTISSLIKDNENIYRPVKKPSRNIVYGSDSLVNLAELNIDTYEKLEKLIKHIENNPIIMKRYKKKNFDKVKLNMFIMYDNSKSLKSLLGRISNNNYSSYSEEEVIKDYNESLNKLMDEYGKLDNIEKNIQEVHTYMELKFIKQYFKIFNLW